jgi:hypothetical protein
LVVVRGLVHSAAACCVATQVSVAHLRPLQAPNTRSDGAPPPRLRQRVHLAHALPASQHPTAAAAPLLAPAPAHATLTRARVHRRTALGAPAFSFDADGALTPAAASAAASTVAEPSSSSAALPVAPPASGLEFERAWRALPRPQRAAYLRLIPPDAFAALFKASEPHTHRALPFCFVSVRRLAAVRSCAACLCRWR